MTPKDYHLLYNKLKSWAERHGYHVYDHDTILDYGGMNAEAAREKGLQHKLSPTDILIRGYEQSWEYKFKTLSHEIIERRKMHYEGWPYKKAHPYAERNQGNLKITEQNPYSKRARALFMLGHHKVLKVHDDGDLTVQQGNTVHVVTTEGKIFREVNMPAKSEAQRKFMGAELGRLRSGYPTLTGMSEKQLKEYAKGPSLEEMHESPRMEKIEKGERVLKRSIRIVPPASHPHTPRRVPMHHVRRGEGVTRRGDR